MEFAFNFPPKLGTAGLLLEAILFSIVGIFGLIIFIVVRRWYRSRYFQHLSERTYFWRSRWEQLLKGKFAAQNWRTKLDRQILEAMLLDAIEVDPGNHLPGLLQCLRSSGLLDLLILEARTARGWKRRTALIALGRTRAAEAVPALAEALGSLSQETRIAAVQGIERTGLPEAALPLLDRVISAQLEVPEHSVKNALLSCCRTRPGILVEYLQRAIGSSRELLARVLGELATSDLQNELLILSADPLPEVRASAARALAIAQPEFALPALSDLANDPVWYVRLRAVVGLASMSTPHRVRPLMIALADPVPSVRKRAAWALCAIAPALEGALAKIVEAEDSRLAESFVTQMDRSGTSDVIVRALQEPGNSPDLSDRLKEVLSRGLSETQQRAAAAGGGVG